MEENKQTQEEQPAQKTGNTEAPSTLVQAEALAKRLEDANRRTEELLKRQEEVVARAMLGGRSFAGQEPEIKKEETPKEYANRIMMGK